MCTVTYLPTDQGFILTHNRDEAPTRSPHKISREQYAGTTILFPKDTRAGGAWIASTRDGRTACLLNGAFEKHKHQPPYRRSRGLVLLDFFEWPDPRAFFTQYDLEDIEPFTFLFFQVNQVMEFRWDGIRRHLQELPPDGAHFWCSATLYPPEMQVRREQVFRDWLAVHRLPSTVYRPPSTVYRPPSTVHPLPSTVHRPPSTVHRPPSTVHRPPSTVHRPPSTVHRLPSTIHRLPPAFDRKRRRPGK